MPFFSVTWMVWLEPVFSCAEVTWPVLIWLMICEVSTEV